VLPAERREAGKQVIEDSITGSPHRIDDPSHIEGVPVDNGLDHEVEGRCPDREILRLFRRSLRLFRQLPLLDLGDCGGHSLAPKSVVSARGETVPVFTVLRAAAPEERD
jgi:hypothetical protein